MNCPKPQAPAAKPVVVKAAPRVITGPVSIDIAPVSDVNPVKTQHVFVATVRDASGTPVPGVEVEWLLTRSGANGVGDIVDVDGGRKLDNTYAKSTTGSSTYTITRGNDLAADDVQIGPGQTWCVITSMEEGQSKMVAYAPGIQNWDNHKAFAVKNWTDMSWEAPADATNRAGTPHTFTFRVFKYSDGTPIPGVIVNWTLVSGPAATLGGGGNTATTRTDNAGVATVTLNQVQPVAGINEVQITFTRPAVKDECGCKPEVSMGPWTVRKTWLVPSIGITKSAPARETVGHEFAYDIVAMNTSNDLDVRDAVVTDPLPAGIQYVSSNPPAEVSGSTLTWRLGTIPAGGSRSMQVIVKGMQSGAFENCATVMAEGNLTARACATTVITVAALQLVKTGPEMVTVCDPIPYTITVTNTGDGEATGVRVVDTLPPGLSSGDQVDWMVGTLGPRESRTFTLVAKASTGGRYTNMAAATADGGLRAEASCTTTVTKCVLAITKTAPAERFTGRPIPYQITVTNTGDSDAKNVVVEDPVPALTMFESATDGGMLMGNTIVWNLGTIARGQSRTVSATVRANQSGTVHNVATARGECCDQVSASADTVVKGVVGILLQTMDIEDPIEVGANETYVIDVTNQGDADDNRVVLKCTLPAQEEFVSAEPPPGITYQVSGKTITFSAYPTLVAKQRITYRVVVKATGAGDVRFNAELTSDMLETPVLHQESTHIY